MKNLVNLITSILFIMFVYSCDGNSTYPKENTVLYKTEYKIDSIYFTYNSDVYSNNIILTQKMEILFNQQRNEEHKVDKKIKKINYINKEKIEDILNNVSSNTYIKDSITDYAKIGIPYTYDQGGYELIIIFSDKSTRHISIDTNSEMWPIKLKSYIEILVKIYTEIEKKEIHNIL